MSKPVVPVAIRGLIPTPSGVAVFLGNDEKTFVIYVDANVGSAISMFINNTPRERPLTHDLLLNIFRGFGISVMRVVITDLKNSTYFARLILKQQNEIETKIVELDAHPSDCLAIASSVKCPIYVSANLFEQLEDMSEFLNDSENFSDENA